MRLFRVGVFVAAALLLAGSPVTGARAAYTAPGARDAAPGSMPAAVVYSQPSNPAGGLLLSSLRDPDGSAVDQWVWDAFTLISTGEIAEIGWSGGHEPSRFGAGGAVANFTVSIYASIPAGTEPDVAHPPLVRYEVGGNAGETAGPVLGGVQMYGYTFALPHAFHALGGTKYWVQIEAYQPGALPDWGLTRGTGGDGSHYRKVAGETQYQRVTGDTAFTLLGTQAPVFKLYGPLLFK